MKNKKLLSILLILIIVLPLCLGVFSGCSFFRLDINDFATELFNGALSGDAMSANFFLENPENVIGTTPTVSLSRPQSYNDYKEGYNSYLLQGALMDRQFKYKRLSNDEKELFDFLQNFFLTQGQYMGYYYFQDNYIGGFSGAQANLPLHLIEYKFRDEQDIKDYISLCKQTETVFPTWVSFEQARVDNGYGRAPFILFFAIEQASSLTGAPIVLEQRKEGEEQLSMEERLICPNPNPRDPQFVENDNFILENAIKKIDKTNLPNDKKATYKAQIKDAINNSLIPSYIKLGNDIKDMLLSVANKGKFKTGGLCIYPNGQNYYQLLINDATCTKDTVREIYNRCLTEFNKEMVEINIIRSNLNTLGVANPDVEIVNMFNTDNWTETGLYQTIDTLKASLNDDFPKLQETSGQVILKTVDKSLSDYYSPAAYYVSALDNKNSDEIIVINNWESTGYLSYDLLSHEGIPGHLYQYNYLKNTNKHNIVKLLNPTGYKEGWATYCEHYMANRYKDNGSKDNLLMRYQLKKVLLKGYIRVMADIAINYSGYGSNIVEGDKNNQFTIEYWLENTLKLTDDSFLLTSNKKEGDSLVFSKTNVRNYANNLAVNSIISPCNAATYYYSYLQMTDIFDALKAKGYSDHDCHKAILDSPYTFTQIKKKYAI